MPIPDRGEWQPEFKGTSFIMKNKMMLENQWKQPLQRTKQRSVRRCPLVASVEVTELQSGTLLSARISELGLGGCYVDALNPFPEGTLVHLRILRDQGVFETNAKVVYSELKFGMGIAFAEMKPEQLSLLQEWLAEIVIQLRPVS